MRIIITEQGEQLIRSLGQDKIVENLQKAQTDQEKQNSPKKRKSNIIPNNTSESGLFEIKSSNGLTKMIENAKNMKNLKVIEIKNKKLSIPKNIAEKYNEIRLEEPSLLPILNQKFDKNSSRGNPNQNQNSNSNKYNPKNSSDLFEAEKTYGTNIQNTKSFNDHETMDTDPSMKMPMSLNVKVDKDYDFMRTSYKMKEIISDKAIDKIKSHIISEVKMRNKLTNVMQNNFRSPFLTPNDKLMDMEEALDKKIKSDKANIIQYLNSKNCLSPKFVKSLSNYDEEKIVRLNKICQRIFNQDNKDNDLKVKINGIIENMHVYQKAEYKRKMGQMEKEVSDIKDIFEKYPKTDNREIYETLLNDVKKRYWDKIYVDKIKIKHLKMDQ
jgi:hypothetical protein